MTDSPFVSPFDYTHHERDKREMCRSCFNEDTTRIRDVVELAPFAAYHGAQAFKAFSCHCCGATFHFADK